MRERLISALKAVEASVPPPVGFHHAIMFAQYGSDKDGWQDRLALQITRPDRSFQIVWLDPGDLEKDPKVLAAEVEDVLAEMTLT